MYSFQSHINVFLLPSSVVLGIVKCYVHIIIYRVSQEERSIVWELIVSVILSKNVYMNMCPIPNGFRDSAI